MRGVRFAASFRVPSGGDAVFLTNRHKLEADAALTLIKQGARQGHASTPGLKRALLNAAGGAALLSCDQSAAWADCSPSAANDIAAICTGIATAQYGNGSQTNGTITVNAGAGFNVAANNYAISFASLTNVYNYGTIAVAPATNNLAIAISAYTAAVTLNNYAGAAVTGTASGTGWTVGLYGKTTVTVASNAGSITATASGTGTAEGVKAD